VAATTLLSPFSSLLEKLATTTIKEKRSEEDDEEEDNLLDERFLDYPPLALEQSGKTMVQMSTAAFKNLRKSADLFHEFNQEKYDKIMSREDRVDRYEDRLGAYLVRLNAKELSDRETQASGKYLTCLSNVERISDHAVNLAELANELAGKQASFSAQAAQELRVCIEAALEIAELTQTTLEKNDFEKARLVEPLEEVIDALSKELKARHIQRVQAGQCTLELGFVFNDAINNLERVADHCSNIAIAVLEAADAHLQSHGYLRSLKQGDQEEYLKQLDCYAQKYYSQLPTLE